VKKIKDKKEYKTPKYTFDNLAFVFFFIFVSSLNHNLTYSQTLISVAPDSLHFIEEPLKIQIDSNYSHTIKLYYSLDSGNTWIRINEPIINNEVNFSIPFTLSQSLKIKAVDGKIKPLKLIWENPHAHYGEIRATNFSPDGKLLLTLGKDGWIKIWRISTKSLIDSLFIRDNSYTYDAKFFHSNTKILFSSGNNSYLWDRTNNSVNVFYTIGNFIRKIDIHPRDNKFAVITDDNNLAVFQQTFFLPLPIFLRLYSNSTYKNSYSLRYSENGNSIAISTFSGKVIITKANYNSQDMVLNLENSPIFCSEFCNNDQFLAYPSSGNILNLYEFNNQQVKGLFPAFESSIRDIKRFKTSYLAAVSLDSTLREWSLEDYSNLPVTIKEPYAILNLDITSTGDTLATSGRNNAFRVWQNFSLDTNSQTIDLNIRQKIYIKIAANKVAYTVGDSCKIAFLMSSQYSNILSKFPLWHFAYNLHIPYKLFDISGLQLFPNNEVFEINSFNFLNDTFKLYEGIALLTDENQGTIAISDINAFEPNNFYYIIENEDVTVLYFCTQLPTPKIFISNNEFYVEQKGTIDNNLKFETNLIEDGNFSIEIYSLDGKLLKKIDQELKHGLYSFDINLQSMSSGVYILKVVSVSQTKYMKFLKI